MARLDSEAAALRAENARLEAEGAAAAAAAGDELRAVRRELEDARADADDVALERAPAPRAEGVAGARWGTLTMADVRAASEAAGDSPARRELTRALRAAQAAGLERERELERALEHEGRARALEAQAQRDRRHGLLRVLAAEVRVLPSARRPSSSPTTASTWAITGSWRSGPRDSTTAWSTTR